MLREREQYPFCLSLAGVQVFTNRALPHSPVDGYTDCSLLVHFASPTEAPPAGRTWHPLTSAAWPPLFLQADGSTAWLPAVAEHPERQAALLRWTVPFASALQGRVIVHAAAVQDRTGVHAFIGESGAGKSTLSATLCHSLPYQPVSDDLLPWRITHGRVGVPLAGQDALCPLAGIYFLSRAAKQSSVALEALSPAAALPLLIRHGFGELPLPQIWQTQFLQYCLAVEQVPAYRLILPDNLALLRPALADWHQLICRRSRA